MALSARQGTKAMARRGQVTVALGRTGLFVMFLSLILEIQAQSILSYARLRSSQRKISHQAGFRNTQGANDGASDVLCPAKREDIAVSSWASHPPQ